MRIGKWTVPPEPRLEEGEVAEHEFEGPFTRVTLTERRIIFSTVLLRDTVVPYDQVKSVFAGFFAGPSDLRDNSPLVVYGIYVCHGIAEHERWAWIPRPKLAAEIITSRSPQC